MLKRLVFLSAFLMLGGCAETPEILTLKPQQFADLNGWETADHSGGVAAFRQSCTAMMKKSPGNSLGKILDRAEYWQPACAAAENVPNSSADAKAFFETYFAPLKSMSSRRPDGLFTGYYEIELQGSRKKTKQYKYPVYMKPPPPLSGFTRAEIDCGALDGKGLELVWVDDAVKLFFMHIQGSGIVHMKEGGYIRLGYDGQNGQTYVALGRWLIDNGYLQKEDLNAPLIQAWLYNNPDLAETAMQQNPSYIYFRMRNDLNPNEGPIGAQNVPLTPRRSLAVDKRFYGYGIPMWIQTQTPEFDNHPAADFNQLLIAQDTGGAIRGAIRGDIFYGRGEQAEKLAGHTNERGNLWVLLPKALAAQYEETGK